ncbi:MAG: 4Fe-4S binding protein [Erysipelotrichaceae bacterium]|nr:4Fe-4S binding protein [Erysipelotrichaceae bacterium]MBQ4253041.1 4Fe-4S binding protein [Erysipelotrichaceae bacterium]MBQ7223268.1 4Fe-4S binding protein [Erysipelotrichaceae bacterium]
MPVEVNKELCIGCGACVGVCPVGALDFGDDGKAESNPDVCIDCGACMGTCPMEAISEKQ